MSHKIDGERKVYVSRIIECLAAGVRTIRLKEALERAGIEGLRDRNWDSEHG